MIAMTLIGLRGSDTAEAEHVSAVRDLQAAPASAMRVVEKTGEFTPPRRVVENRPYRCGPE